MTKNKKVDVQSAIVLLKSGGSIENVIISDLTTSKVKVMDALLLAENGCIVPDANILYDDEHIQYDPDFDEVTWGQPMSFNHLKEALSSETPPPTEVAAFLVQVPVKNPPMREWLTKNQGKLHVEILELIERMYKSQSH